MPKNTNIKKNATAIKNGAPQPREYTSTIRPGQPHINRGHTILKQPVSATYQFGDLITDEHLDQLLSGETVADSAGASVLSLMIPTVKSWKESTGDIFSADSRGIFIAMKSAKLGIRNKTSIPITLHIRSQFAKYRGDKGIKAGMSNEKIIEIPPYTATSGPTDYKVVDFYARPGKGQSGLIWSGDNGDGLGNSLDYYAISSFFFTYNSKTIATGEDIPAAMDAVEILTPEDRGNNQGKQVSYGILYQADTNAFIDSEDPTIPVKTREAGVAAVLHQTDVKQFYTYPAAAGEAIASFGASAVNQPMFAWPDSQSREFRSIKPMPHPQGGLCFVLYNLEVNTGRWLDPVEINGAMDDDYWVIDPALTIHWDRDQNDSHDPHSQWNVTSAYYVWDKLIQGFVLQDGYGFLDATGKVAYHGKVDPKIPVIVGQHDAYKRNKVNNLLTQGEAEFVKTLWVDPKTGTLKEVLASTAKSFALGMLDLLIRSIVL